MCAQRLLSNSNLDISPSSHVTGSFVGHSLSDMLCPPAAVKSLFHAKSEEGVTLCSHVLRKSTHTYTLTQIDTYVRTCARQECFFAVFVFVAVLALLLSLRGRDNFLRTCTHEYPLFNASHTDHGLTARRTDYGRHTKVQAPAGKAGEGPATLDKVWCSLSLH